MCKYASFVLTKDKVFWSTKTESHAEIITEFNLCEADSTGQRINILKTEISPTTCWGDLSKWEYKVDQDIMPPWYDVADCERRTRKALGKKIGTKLLRNFKLLDKFLSEINTTRFLTQHGKPLKKWKIYRGKTWAAARDAAWDAARDAAWDAAWDAAGAAAGAAAWDAAWDAARDAAWDAARDAARDAAWDAARDAAWDAARDAGLKAQMIICADLKINPKHVKHTNDRWEVWRRGYGLLCDIDGVLYVYGLEEKP